MTSIDPDRGVDARAGLRGDGVAARHDIGPVRHRRSTETKAACETTEMIA
jgi:hypothetical protein